MKILHVLIEAARGGCERNCLLLCRTWRRIRHDVLVLGGRGDMSEELEAVATQVTHLKLRSRSWFSTIKPTREYLRTNPPDGAILWHGMVELPQLLHAFRDRVIPLVVHGGNPASSMPAVVDLKFRVLELLMPVLRRPPYACCSKHVADSFESSSYLRRFRRYVVQNGVDDHPEAVHRPRSLSVAEPITIGMMARLDSIKDHPTLIRAIADLRQTYPRARLQLAGDGERIRELRVLVRELGLQETVSFLGSVADVYATIADWDLFAYAATPAEGFGNAVAEALMCGLPCVLSDLPPLREVCGKEDVAVFVPAADPAAMASALTSLIPDLPRRQHLSEAARRRALSDLAANSYARKYADLLAAERDRLLRGHSNT